jgi:ligand-binding sensor domain-containing protein
MRLKALRRALALVFLLGIAPGARAQFQGWQAYPSLREVRAVDASADALWTATAGGVFAYRPASGEVTRYTPIEGLQGVEAAALAYDARRDAVWIGYADGGLDRLDVASGAVTAFLDVARADQYPDRSIRRLRVHGDSLFIATGFGLVVFDPVRGEVRDTYARLGPLTPATPATDALVAPLPDGRAGLWIATDGGVVYADLASPNLQQPSAWTLDPAAPVPARCLAAFEGRVHACSESGASAREPDGAWVPVFFSAVSELDAHGGALYGAAGFGLLRRLPGGATTSYTVSGYGQLVAVEVGPDGAVWVGDAQGGLLRLPPLGPETGSVTVSPAQVVVPSGPFNNAIQELALEADGTLWAAHEQVGGPSAISRLDAGAWTPFASTDYDLPNAGFRSAAVAPDGTFYSASFGDGLAAVAPDGTVTTYRSDNSTLLPAFGTSVILGDAVPDAAGLVWVTNRGVALPLHVLTPERTWTALPFPPGMPTNVFLNRMVLDAFGTKWITLRSSTTNAGAGIAAISTGADPFSPSDDRALAFTSAGSEGTGLPSEDTRALALDREGRLWIGTARGLGIVFSPGSAFGGDPALVTPQWARTADGASYLLRDLAVNDLAVDPAGQLWIASTTGAWLLNAAGDSALVNLTSENSPLFSDNVIAVAVDGSTGRVYFATERGLLSMAGEATAPSAEARELAVAPSPYRPAQHARGVLISGLVAETTVFVLTPDGQRIAALEAVGGSVRWDGRDERTGEAVASGVYLVAAVAADGQATAYGKVAVIR